MKFNFKIQQYQTDAVEAVVRVFSRQGYQERTTYIRDLGKGYVVDEASSYYLSVADEDDYDLDNDLGYKNEQITLSDDQLLQNIRQIQNENNIRTSPSLVKQLGKCSLDV